MSSNRRDQVSKHLPSVYSTEERRSNSSKNGECYKPGLYLQSSICSSIHGDLEGKAECVIQQKGIFTTHTDALLLCVLKDVC